MPSPGLRSQGTNKDKENLRNVFMQERSFEWIKVNTDYLKDVNSNIENEENEDSKVCEMCSS